MEKNNSSVLVVSASNNRRAALANVLDREGWRVIHADSLAAVTAALSANPGVVVTDYSLPDGRWTAVLGQIHEQASAAELVVLSRLADEQMWSEVVLCGGYDLIPEPFEDDEVLRVIGSAFRESPERNRSAA